MLGIINLINIVNVALYDTFSYIRGEHNRIFSIKNIEIYVLYLPQSLLGVTFISYLYSSIFPLIRLQMRTV